MGYYNWWILIIAKIRLKSFWNGYKFLNIKNLIKIQIEIINLRKMKLSFINESEGDQK